MPHQHSAFSRKRTFYLGLLALVHTVTFFPVWKSLVTAWLSHEELSHGLLIPPVFIFTLWARRKDLAALPVVPSNWGLLLVSLALLGYVCSYYAEVRTLASYSMVLSFAGIVFFLFGPVCLRALIFPFFILCGMIPVPAQVYSSLTIPLQLTVSKLSAAIVGWAGIPVYRDGNVIHLSDHVFEVVTACSGIRSITSLLALSAILSYFFLKTWPMRSLLMVMVLPVAIVVNAARVVLLIVFFHCWNVDLSMGPIHKFYGQVLFLIAFLTLVTIQLLLTRYEK